jgi:hypothetical protein
MTGLLIVTCIISVVSLTALCVVGHLYSKVTSAICEQRNRANPSILEIYRSVGLSVSTEDVVEQNNQDIKRVNKPAKIENIKKTVVTLRGQLQLIEGQKKALDEIRTNVTMLLSSIERNLKAIEGTVDSI